MIRIINSNDKFIIARVFFFVANIVCAAKLARDFIRS